MEHILHIYSSCAFIEGCRTSGESFSRRISSSRLAWSYFLLRENRFSQDVVDGSGSRVLRSAGLRVGAAGGEGCGVPQGSRSTAGLHGGQAVNNARQALQAGGAGCLVVQTLWNKKDAQSGSLCIHGSPWIPLKAAHVRLQLLSESLTILCIRIAAAVVCIQLLPHRTAASCLEGHKKWRTVLELLKTQKHTHNGCWHTQKWRCSGNTKASNLL